MQKLNEEELILEDTQEDLYLTFLLGEDTFGIGIGYVKEIIGIMPITAIPEFPDHIRGVINLRGRIIPVMDVRLRFKRPAMEYDSRTCIIVVEILETSIGLIVDRVAEVVAIPEHEIAAPPEINRREAGYIQGFGKVGNEINVCWTATFFMSNEAKIVKQERENQDELV
jgi:purine-binding chemotaxis protein CheW